MKKNQGFTLIELIIVIVILGILAAVATPKLLSLSSDARIAEMDGLKGALSAGVNLVHNKALIDSEEDEKEGSVTINGEALPIRYGYPRLHISEYNANNAFSNQSSGNNKLSLWMDLDTVENTHDTDSEWEMEFSNPELTVTFTIYGYSPETVGTCQVVYTWAIDASTAATVTIDTSGC